MLNIKLKNAQGVEQTYSEVRVLKVKDTNNVSHKFVQADGVAIAFISVAGSPQYSLMSVSNGTVVVPPLEPTREGYFFRGWSSVSHAYIPANRITFPHTFTEDTMLYAMWEQKPTSGYARISGLGSENPSSVTFEVSENFPSSFTTFTDDLGDSWIEIPTCYRKVVTTADGQIIEKIVSFEKTNDDYKPYPVFVKPDGVTVMPYVRIGKFMFTSLTKASSESGDRVTMTIGAGRTLARERGTGYQVYDWQFRELWIDLCLIKERNVNFNALHEDIPEYLGMSHFNGGHWIDGLARDGSTWRIAYDPSKYVDNPTSSTQGYSALGYTAPTTSDREVRKLGYDSDHPFAQFPNDIVQNTSYNTFYCDGYYYSSGNHPVTSDLGSSNANAGLFYFYTYRAWTYADGVRLCYRPI